MWYAKYAGKLFGPIASWTGTWKACMGNQKKHMLGDTEKNNHSQELPFKLAAAHEAWA